MASPAKCNGVVDIRCLPLNELSQLLVVKVTVVKYFGVVSMYCGLPLCLLLKHQESLPQHFIETLISTCLHQYIIFLINEGT